MNDVLMQYLMNKLESGKDSVVTLQGGAAVEQIDNEIQRVIENICDTNNGMGVRKIKLELHAKPMDEGRSMIKWAIHVPPAALCGQDPMVATSMVKVDANGKGLYTKERVVEQLPIVGGNQPIPMKKIGGNQS